MHTLDSATSADGRDAAKRERAEAFNQSADLHAYHPESEAYDTPPVYVDDAETDPAFLALGYYRAHDAAWDDDR